jgi:hypothetical protein
MTDGNLKRAVPLAALIDEHVRVMVWSGECDHPGWVELAPPPRDGAGMAGAARRSGSCALFLDGGASAAAP